MDYQITREISINGESTPVKYSLTGIEMGHVFNMVQAQNDSDLLYAVLREKEYEDVENIPEELIDEMAERFRKEINDMLAMTMENVVDAYEEKLEPYKEKWKVFSKTVHVTIDKEYTIKAKNEEDADRIFDAWYERHSDRVESDMAEDMWNGDWEVDDAEEEEYCDPDNADIEEDDI